MKSTKDNEGRKENKRFKIQTKRLIYSENENTY